MSGALLEVADLWHSYGGAGASFRLVVDSLRVTPGATLAVVGPSGCGKSTLLGLLALALRPTGGTRLSLDGADALALWRHRHVDRLTRLRCDLIGFVPQTSALLPFLTIAGNIALPLRLAGSANWDRVGQLASRLGIADVLNRHPAEVSVGQRQRAALARALVRRPRLVLADEPTASVHPAQAEEVLKLLAGIAAEDGAAVVIATHDRDRAAAAGFAIAFCATQADGITTRIGWPM